MSSSPKIKQCKKKYMWPTPHPIRMQGMNIPAGEAVPDDKQVNMNHTKEKAKAFSKRISL